MYTEAEFIKKLTLKIGKENVGFGASVVLYDHGWYIFTLVKPKDWRVSENGLMTIDFSGIGGALEENEASLNCAIREVEEETGIMASALDFSSNEHHKTCYIRDNVQVPHSINYSGNITPLAIFEHKIPSQYLKEGQGSDFTLILFIYLAKLLSSGITPDTNEKIPGYVYFANRHINESIKGTMVKSADLRNDKFKLEIKKKFIPHIPPVFEMSPKFTPSAIIAGNIDLQAYY